MTDPPAAASVAAPSRGLSMAQVESRFGEPSQRVGAVGDPPISRWVYPQFVVYFEGSYVIHAVARRRHPPAELDRPAALPAARPSRRRSANLCALSTGRSPTGRIAIASGSSIRVASYCILRAFETRNPGPITAARCAGRGSGRRRCRSRSPRPPPLPGRSAGRVHATMPRSRAARGRARVLRARATCRCSRSPTTRRCRTTASRRTRTSSRSGCARWPGCRSLARGIVLADLPTALQRLPPRNFIDAHCARTRASVRSSISRPFRLRLTAAGYASVPQVGDTRRVRDPRLAVRHLPDGQRRATAHRSRSTGEIDSIRSFDAETQRSTDRLDSDRAAAGARVQPCRPTRSAISGAASARASRATSRGCRCTATSATASHPPASSTTCRSSSSRPRRCSTICPTTPCWCCRRTPQARWLRRCAHDRGAARGASLRHRTPGTRPRRKCSSSRRSGSARARAPHRMRELGDLTTPSADAGRLRRDSVSRGA